jgi:hypothetical protein
MNPLLIAALILIPMVPPLTEGQRVRLDTAIDGRDHQEEAFVALLEHIRSWDPGVVPGDAPVIVQPDLEAMIAAPEAFRGALCRVEGVIQQQRRLDRPYEGVAEWFVRDDSGRPLLVFVADLGSATAARFGDGRRAVLHGRFYKRIDALARDGERRAYAAFVAQRPAEVIASPGGSNVGAVVGIGLAVSGLFIVFLAVWVWSRRRGPARRSMIGVGAVASLLEVDDSASLPDDPTEALAELKRRAEESD